MASTSPTSSPVTSRLPGVSSLRRSGEINLDSDSEEATERLVSKVRDRVLVKPVEQEQPFDKVKATRSYSVFSTVCYKFLSARKTIFGKGRIVGLSDDQAESLNLFREHNKLCTEIDKVQSVFKTYRGAQEVADEAPIEPAIRRTGARQEAQAAGDNLERSYEDLIAFAINQAAKIGLDQTAFIEDVNKKLGKGTEDYILRTVNELRARKPVESCLLTQLGDPHEVGLRRSYIDFVTDFITKIQSADQKSAGSADVHEITRAFIRGLASIPELAEGLNLVELYDALNNKESMQQVRYNQLHGVMEHFMNQLEALMNKPEAITPEELNNIQLHGIPFSSILPSITALQLNTLKSSKTEHREVSDALAANEQALAQNQKVTTDRAGYSYRDVLAFLTEIGKEAQLAGPANDETPFSRLAKATQAKGQIIERLTARLAQLNTDKAAQGQADAVAIQQVRDAIGTAGREIVRLDEVITEEQSTLASLELALAAIKNGSKVAQARIIADIDDTKGELTATAAERTNQRAELKRLQERLPVLEEEVRQRAEVAARNTNILAEEIDGQRQDASMIDLSGAEVAAIARHLDVKISVNPQSKIAMKVNATNTASTNVLELETKTLPGLRARLDDLTRAIQDESVMTVNLDGSFAANKNLFGEPQRALISAQIESNILIAKKVTIASGRNVVSKNQKIIADQTPAKTKMSHSIKAAFEDFDSKLGRELLIRERAEVNKQDVFSMIQDRIAKLPKPVVLAPVARPVSIFADDTQPMIDEFELVGSEPGSAPPSGSASPAESVVVRVPAAATVALGERLEVLPVDDLLEDDTSVFVADSSKPAQAIVTPEREIINTL